MAKLSSMKTFDAERDGKWDGQTGRNYCPVTSSDRSGVVLNCYDPGTNDEMHCHPGSDHIFFVVEGECTVKGLFEGEEIRLARHQGVHIPAGYFYQLNNTGSSRLILYQVRTEPETKPAKAKVIYGLDTTLKGHILGEQAA